MSKQNLNLFLYGIRPSDSSQFDDMIIGLFFDFIKFFKLNLIYHFLNFDQSLPPIKEIL